MQDYTKWFRSALLAGTLMPFAVPSAAAQEVASQGTDAPDDNVAAVEAATDAEIIVTANRREERLQDVPLSVTVVKGEDLFNRGVSDPQQLSAISPSLQTQNGAASPQGSNFAVRGVGTASFQRTIESSVALVIDDVALLRPEMGVVNFADIAQIEVLNGPQGMLFGKNASAGLVHIRTANPVLDEFGGRVQSEYSVLNRPGDAALFRVSGTVNVPISSEAAARINLNYKKNSSLVRLTMDNPGIDAGIEQIGGSAKLLWKPTDRLSILLAGDYMDSAGMGTGMVAFRQLSPGSFYGPILAAAGITPGPRNAASAYDQPTFVNAKVGGGQLKIDYDLGDGLMLTNIAAARFFKVEQESDQDYSPAKLIDRFTEPKSFRQFSNELRIASPAGRRFDYQLGLYYLNGRVHQSNLIEANVGGAPPPGFNFLLGNHLDQVQNLESFAAFGQGTYRLTDSLRAVVGARLTYDKLDMQYEATAAGGLINPFGLANSPVIKRNNTDLSWRGTLQYDIDTDRMIYATAARGYKGPGFSQFSTDYVRPEISKHYELGLKSQFFDRKLTLNLAAFHTAFTDFQAQSVDFTNGQFRILVQNAGKLVTKGFDLQLVARPLDGLTVSGGLAYADAKFKSFLGDVCYPGQLDCVGGVTDSSGRRLPNAPKWKGLLDVHYETSIGRGLVGGMGGTFSSQSDVFFTSNGDPSTRQEGYSTVDFDLSLGAEDGAWRAKVFCRNCGDKRYVSYIAGTPLNGADYVQQFGVGSFRSIGASIEVKF